MDDLGIPQTGKKRVVIAGGGFAGLKLSKTLSPDKFQVVLLDRNNYHNFQPLLYQVAMGGLEPDSIAFPLRKSTRRKSTFFRMADILRVDPEKNTLVTSEGDLHYDELVIATGSKTNFFGNASLEKNALTLKSIPGALDLRSWIFQNLEAAVLEREKEGFLTIVIVGGGPTGVEIAGALSDLKRHVLPKDYPELKFSQFRIIIVENGDRLLGAMSEDASGHAARYLLDMGVEVKLKQLVKEYDGKEVLLGSGEKIKAEILIWSAGVIGNPLEGIRPEALRKNLRYEVNTFNRVKGYENIYAVGDVASMSGPEGRDHPMLAPVAIQQSVNLAQNLNRNRNDTWHEFKYVNKGVLATIGRNKAVAEFGPLKLHGFLAWIIWVFVHLMTLVGFRNRLIVFNNWLWSYISFDSALRLIIRPLRKKPKPGETVQDKILTGIQEE